jgi:DedD protein
MPQNEPEVLIDGQLNLKKRSRRRLVGAAALALLAIIVLPMVMDEEPRQAVQDLQIRIPSQDASGIAARILPTKPAPSPMAADEGKPKAEALGDNARLPPADTGKEAVSIAPDKAGKSADKPVAAKPSSDLSSADKSAAEKAAAEKLAADKAATEKKAADAKADTARAAAALSGKAADEQWLVLLGAYKEEANIKQLMAKLKQMGLPVFTERYDSPQGPRTRVRSGPFKSREAAEKAADRIKKIGVDGQVAQAK